MTTSVKYPNGQQLVSSALSDSDMNKLMQNWTLSALGINPPDYSLVRVDWQREGQPFGTPSQDIAYLGCTMYDDPYTKVRNRTADSSDNVSTTKVWTYTRAWEVKWVLYGPNSLDRCRMIHTATFLDYFNDLLNADNLFPLSDPPVPSRNPEKINGQWYNRSDFLLRLYENVTETIQDNIVKSVEVLVNNNDGQQADFTVLKP